MRARTTTGSRLSFLTAATLLALAGTPTLALPVIGDFNNDANVDILWQHRYGLILYWACDGNPLNQHFVMGAASLNPTPGHYLRLVGSGDFDADSFTDLLFSNTLTGETVVVTRPGEGNAQQHALPAAPTRDWRIVAIADFNNDAWPDLLWRVPREGRTVIWLVENFTVTQSIDLPLVTQRSWHPVGAGDFTNDGETDILWRNYWNGECTIWQMNATSVTANIPFDAGSEVPNSGWRILDVADYDGDDEADILWGHNEGKQITVWQMDGLDVYWRTHHSEPLDPYWVVAGHSDLEGVTKKDDFNNDARADIFWRNSNGSAVMWLMHDEDTIGPVISLPWVASNNWTMSAVGDLSIDGNADLLWRNSVTGQNSVWFMNGTSLAEIYTLPNASIDWSIFAIADANNDANPDIYWYNNTTGEILAWRMECGRYLQFRGLWILPTQSDLTWVPCGADDIDRNHTPDIFFQNANGQVRAWLMNGDTLLEEVALPSLPGADWRIVKVSDMNDDGTPDLLIRNRVTGEIHAWLLDAQASDLFGSSIALPTVSDPAWQVQECGVPTP
jgi:hypothetical protein